MAFRFEDEVEEGGYHNGFNDGMDEGYKTGWNEAIDKCVKELLNIEGKDTSTWKSLLNLKIE